MVMVIFYPFYKPQTFDPRVKIAIGQNNTDSSLLCAFKFMLRYSGREL